jgi:transposase-like protein
MRQWSHHSGRFGSPEVRSAAWRSAWAEDIRVPDVLAAVREQRFATGVRCPRCLATSIQRWGSFSGRLRYRCSGCLRTFSDLTLTPAAYTKRLECWPRYCAQMLEGMSIRRSALFAQPSTAFRWRHAILRALVAADKTTLAGLIEMEETGFAYSQKGSRKLTRPPRPRGVWDILKHRWKTPRVTVPIAYDRRGFICSAVVLAAATNFADLRTLITTRVVGRGTIMANYGPSSRYCGAARGAGHVYHVTPRFKYDPAANPLHHTRNVDSYILRLRMWLERFRGVATRYLAHYLRWHHLIEALLGPDVSFATFLQGLPRPAPIPETKSA